MIEITKENVLRFQNRIREKWGVGLKDMLSDDLNVFREEGRKAGLDLNHMDVVVMGSNVYLRTHRPITSNDRMMQLAMAIPRLEYAEKHGWLKLWNSYMTAGRTFKSLNKKAVKSLVEYSVISPICTEVKGQSRLANKIINNPKKNRILQLWEEAGNG